MQTKVLQMTPKHVPAVVQTHLASFPNFFLSFLGSRFLELYYLGICTAPEGIAFVYLSDTSTPAGFVAGTSDPAGFYSRLLKRNWFHFAIASLSAVFRRPSIVPRLFRALLYPTKNPRGKNVAGLYSVGVLPELQGTGAGKNLVRSFLFEAKRRGCAQVFLTTDRDNNDAVNCFYASLGFYLERHYLTPEGRRMNEYWINLSEEY